MSSILRAKQQAGHSVANDTLLGPQQRNQQVAGSAGIAILCSNIDDDNSGITSANDNNPMTAVSHIRWRHYLSQKVNGCQAHGHADPNCTRRPGLSGAFGFRYVDLVQRQVVICPDNLGTAEAVPKMEERVPVYFAQPVCKAAHHS
eukprot:scaffold15043_cov17-Prasinocladus_malaysianus.AAC.1